MSRWIRFNKRKCYRFPRAILFALLVPAVVTVAGSYDLSRLTIDGGGTVFSTGGNFEVSGTIGQPEAGLMQGGAYSITGGFWIEQVPSDCNMDGAVDLYDYETFASCITGPDNMALGIPCTCFDLDGDDDVDMEDAAEFQRSFGG